MDTIFNIHFRSINLIFVLPTYGYFKSEFFLHPVLLHKIRPGDPLPLFFWMSPVRRISNANLSFISILKASSTLLYYVLIITHVNPIYFSIFQAVPLYQISASINMRNIFTSFNSSWRSISTNSTTHHFARHYIYISSVVQKLTITIISSSSRKEHYGLIFDTIL